MFTERTCSFEITMKTFIVFYGWLSTVTFIQTVQCTPEKEVRSYSADIKRVQNSHGNNSLLWRPSSCAELLLDGKIKSGIYTIYPRVWMREDPIQVYCDMETDCGGWTVFQRRNNYSVQENFYRDWQDYRKGFGNLGKDFWLGNDNLFILTNQDQVSLRVDLENWQNKRAYAVYEQFHVSDCRDQYRISVGNYSGTAGDSLRYHNTAPFITFDNGDVNLCARSRKGGWWYVECHECNLNGLYSVSNVSKSDRVIWYGFEKYNLLKHAEMKLRPKNFFQCGE